MDGDDKQALLQHGVKSGISGRLRRTALAGQTSTVQTPTLTAELAAQFPFQVTTSRHLP